MLHKKYAAIIALTLGTSVAFASSNNDTELPQLPEVGNFLLQSSQQPGPLLGLGENILDKGQTQVSMLMDDYSGPGVRAVDAIPGVLYGITNSLSIFVNVPFALDFQQPGQHSSGIEDIYVQMEYAYYTKNTNSYEDQATLVANVFFPTGTPNAQPPTGDGSFSYLLGTTFNRTYENWFAFTAPGVILTTAHNGRKFGNQYFYQFGLGRNIKNIGKTWLIALLAELTGSYAEKNRFAATGRDFNSGGNTVLLTPSVWIANKNLVVQFGVGTPVVQTLNGSQHKIKFVLAGNISWIFV